MFTFPRRKTHFNDLGRYAAHHSVWRDILADHGSGPHNRAYSNFHSGEDDGVIAEPHVMPYADLLFSPPVEEAVIVLAKAIPSRPVGKMVLAGLPGRVIAGVDADMVGYGGEFTYGGVNNVTSVAKI